MFPTFRDVPYRHVSDFESLNSQLMVLQTDVGRLGDPADEVLPGLQVLRTGLDLLLHQLGHHRLNAAGGESIHQDIFRYPISTILASLFQRLDDLA